VGNTRRPKRAGTIELTSTDIAAVRGYATALFRYVAYSGLGGERGTVGQYLEIHALVGGGGAHCDAAGFLSAGLKQLNAFDEHYLPFFGDGEAD
jgi:hypothetical protein